MKEKRKVQHIKERPYYNRGLFSEHYLLQKQEKSLARKEPLRQFVNPESASIKRLEDALEWTEDAFKEFVKTLVRRILSLSDILDVYHKYASAVQTLARRIYATDELIDGIVYRLYGLTEEEIRLVEESMKR